MRDTNIVVMAGRLTKDPEVSQTQNGFKSVRFTLASSDDFRRQTGEEVKRTNFVQCEAYGGTADIISKYAYKGKQVVVIGKMYVRESDKDGKKVWFSGVTVENVQLFGTVGKTDKQGTSDFCDKIPTKENQRREKQAELTEDDPFAFPEDLLDGLEPGNKDVPIPF